MNKKSAFALQYVIDVTYHILVIFLLSIRRSSIWRPIAVRPARLPEGAVGHVCGQIASGNVTLSRRTCYRYPLSGIRQM